MLKFKKNKGLSFIIHTKNEENNISDCIDSVKEIVNEILVIDMKSSDRTTEIAKSKGAKIIKVKDMGFADPARNFGISKANHEWVLYLDADERLPKTLQKIILQIIDKDKFDLVRFPRKNIILKKWIKHGMWWPDYHLRLFKKGFLFYPGNMHAQPKYHGRLLILPQKVENAIIHHHRSSIREFLSMIDHYSSLDKSFVREVVKKKKINSDDVINFINKEFDWRYFEHKGYLDGMHGFVINMFMNFYRFLEFAKYWEKKGFEEFFSYNQLRESLSKHSQESAELNIIKSSKFYKLWRLYHNIQEGFLKKKNV